MRAFKDPFKYLLKAPVPYVGTCKLCDRKDTVCTTFDCGCSGCTECEEYTRDVLDMPKDSDEYRHLLYCVPCSIMKSPALREFLKKKGKTYE